MADYKFKPSAKKSAQMNEWSGNRYNCDRRPSKAYPYKIFISKFISLLLSAILCQNENKGARRKIEAQQGQRKIVKRNANNKVTKKNDQIIGIDYGS